jgi:predicted transposase YdaD
MDRALYRARLVDAHALAHHQQTFSEGGHDASEEKGREEGKQEGQQEDDEEKELEEVARRVRAASAEAARGP